MEATSLRRLQASILAALPVLALVLIPEKSSAQIFGTPCDNAPAYRGAYCYNWNSPGMGALFLSQNYVIIVDAGNGYVKASTPVAARKNDAPAGDQAAIANVAGMTPFSGGGGLIQTTSG